MADTRFLYIADTHIESPEGELVPELFQTLTQRIRDEGKVDFILHGGDFVDVSRPQAIRRAAALAHQLPVPLYLCLGEHDLGEPEAEAAWLELAPALFPGQRTDWTLEAGGIRLDAVPPGIERFEPVLADGGAPPRIVCTHTPVLGRPWPEGGTLADRLLRAGGIRAILASHNHYTSLVERERVSFVAVGALGGWPHPYAEIRIEDQQVSVTLRRLGDAVPAASLPTMDTTYLGGQIIQRPPPPGDLD